MENLFLLTFLLSPVLLIVLLIKPKYLSKLKITNPTRLKSVGISLLLFVASFIGFGMTSDSSASIENNAEAIQESVLSAENEQLSSESENTSDLYLITEVVDGDTVKIEGGQSVRFIGIDTPETVHPTKPVECYGKEASDKTKELLTGKTVRLEKDVSETDKYGRLLRYVWIDDVLINELLVKQGYAHASSYPPDVKYQGLFSEAEKYARENNLGLWGAVCNTPTPTIKATTKPTTAPTTKPVTNSAYSCNCSKTCSQISTCDEAYYLLNVCGCTERDGDLDGIPCESLCN